MPEEKTIDEMLWDEPPDLTHEEILELAQRILDEKGTLQSAEVYRLVMLDGDMNPGPKPLGPQIVELREKWYKERGRSVPEFDLKDAV
jgi:hypothetical protein